MLQSHLQTSALSYISTRSKKHCHDNDTISNTHRPTEGKRVRDLRPRPKSKITRQKIKCTVRQIIPSQSTLTEMHKVKEKKTKKKKKSSHAESSNQHRPRSHFNVKSHNVLMAQGYFFNLTS